MANDAPSRMRSQMASNAPIARRKLCALSHSFRSPTDGAEVAAPQRSDQMAKDAPNARRRARANRNHHTHGSKPKMPQLQLPNRLEREKSREPSSRECPAHRAWVRRHHCCVPGCLRRPVECAHVRRNTDGGVALKPSDRWSISLCGEHHLEQHQVGEHALVHTYGVDLRDLAKLFARRSPHHRKL